MSSITGGLVSSVLLNDLICILLQPPGYEPMTNDYLHWYFAAAYVTFPCFAVMSKVSKINLNPQFALNKCTQMLLDL